MSQRDEEREEAPKCPHCKGKGCHRCQMTGYKGGREP
jgi:type II secretory ATPase GspE/PulE/Tfp pilus assembly ATPase PilB-like protein